MPPTTNRKLLAWVDEVAALTKPDRVEWCDGSAEEYDRLCEVAGRRAAPSPGCPTPSGPTATGRAPTPATWPGSRTGPSSAPRTRPTPGRPTTGATPTRCAAIPDRSVPGCHEGPDDVRGALLDGPLGSPIAHIGVEITDSAYVAVSMRIMTRMGRGALEVLGEDGDFVPCLHSVGAPARRRPGRRALALRRREQVHRPLPRDAGRSGPTAPATAATPCSARSASPCASPRSWPATTAGWPSTC